MSDNELAGLGRLVSIDPRDKEYKLPKKASQAAPVTRRFWHVPSVLDQMDTPQCVGYSGWNFLAAGPIRNKPPFTPEWLYKQSQKVDEWPGENYEGTSVRACFKILKRENFVSEYRWAWDAETVINHLLTTGPVVMGTVWTTEMFMPHIKSNFIDMGTVRRNDGGHAYLLVGANRDRKSHTGERGAVRLVNSWGRGWGDGGRAWLSFNDLDKLIKLDGEACTATEIKKV